MWASLIGSALKAIASVLGLVLPYFAGKSVARGEASEEALKRRDKARSKSSKIRTKDDATKYARNKNKELEE